MKGDIGRPSGRMAASASANGVPSSTARVTSHISRSRSRLTTNAGASFTRTAFFRSSLAVAKAVASVSSSVASARTTSSSGSTATGLKKWNPTIRSGCSRSAAMAETESDEVLVARTQVGRDVLLEIGEHRLLHRQLFEDRLDHEVAVPEIGQLRGAGGKRPEPVGSVRGEATFAEQPVDLGLTDANPLSTRSWSRSDITTGT